MRAKTNALLMGIHFGLKPTHCYMYYNIRKYKNKKSGRLTTGHLSLVVPTTIISRPKAK